MAEPGAPRHEGDGIVTDRPDVVLLVRAADAVVAIGGEWGTLSEIALAIKNGTPVVGLDTWDLGRGEIEVAPDPAAAVARAFELSR